MGEVYLARQLSMDRDVALKVLPPQFAIHPQLVDRFRQEVRLAAKVEHPNLVTAYEAGQDDGIHFLAMALVDGETLDAILRRERALPEQSSLQICLKVASGLAQAWNRHHLLHRDIKPGNIMIDRHGEPRLTDLGLAKCLDDGEPLTVTATIMGTPNYMSPEQIQGLADIDWRSDQYGLGATLYHLVTGTVPFKGNSLTDTLRKQVSETLPDPRDQDPTITESCVDLLERMLAKDRAHRYASYEDLIDDIDRALNRRPGSSPRLAASQSMLTRSDAFRRTGGEKKKVAWSASGPGEMSQARMGQRPHRDSRRKLWLSAVAAAVVVTILVVGGVLWVNDGQRIEPETVEPRSTAASHASEMVEPGDPDRDALPNSEEIKEHPAEWVKTEENSPGDELPLPPGETRSPNSDSEVGPPKDIGVTAGAEEERRRRLTALADSLLHGDLVAARRTLASADQDPAMTEIDSEWSTIKHTADQAINLPATIMQAYSPDVGKQTTVHLTTGARSLRIDSVTPNRVRATELIVLDGRVAGSSVLNLTYDRLSLREKQIRLGQDHDPDQTVMHGLLALRHNDRDSAAASFQRSGTRLGQILAERLRQEDTARRIAEEDQRKTRAETAATRQYANLLKILRIPFSGQSPDALARQLRHTLASEAQIQRIQMDLASFLSTYRDTDLATAHTEVLRVLGELTPDMPLYVDRATVDQAIEHLQALHAGITIKVAIEHREDLLAIDLGNNPFLEDISPLMGLPIQSLNLSGSGVQVLDPLRGMPLRKLVLGGCGNIKDLAPLKGMQLTWLDVGNCDRHLDLRPLEGMPLETLSAESIYDLPSLKPLTGMPLKKLSVNACVLISDLSPLRGAPLTHFEAVSCTALSDLSPLKDMPLVNVDVSNCPELTDIAPLAECPLEYLNIRLTGVTDLSPLHNLENLTVTR